MPPDDDTQWPDREHPASGSWPWPGVQAGDGLVTAHDPGPGGPVPPRRDDDFFAVERVGEPEPSPALPVPTWGPTPWPPAPAPAPAHDAPVGPPPGPRVDPFDVTSTSFDVTTSWDDAPPRPASSSAISVAPPGPARPAPTAPGHPGVPGPGPSSQPGPSSHAGAPDTQLRPTSRGGPTGIGGAAGFAAPAGPQRTPPPGVGPMPFLPSVSPGTVEGRGAGVPRPGESGPENLPPGGRRPSEYPLGGGAAPGQGTTGGIPVGGAWVGGGQGDQRSWGGPPTGSVRSGGEQPSGTSASDRPGSAYSDPFTGGFPISARPVPASAPRTGPIPLPSIGTAVAVDASGDDASADAAVAVGPADAAIPTSLVVPTDVGDPAGAAIALAFRADRHRSGTARA